MIDSYDRLTVGTYERLLAIQDQEGIDENELTLEVLAVLARKTVDELMQMPLEEYYEIRARGSFLLLQPEPREIRDAYELGGWRVRPVRKVQEMTAAQFIDFKEWAKLKGRHTAAILSCFLVPEGKRYGEGYDGEELIKAINDHLAMSDAVALDAFFFCLSIRSIHASLSSLDRGMTPLERMRPEARRWRRALRALRKSGAGWRRWTPWLSLPATLGTASTQDRP